MIPALILASLLGLAWVSGTGMHPWADRLIGRDAVVMVTTDAVNLRSGPSTNQDVVTVVESGQQVQPTGPETNGFLPVKTSSGAGWIASAYLSQPPSGMNWAAPVGASAATETSTTSDTATTSILADPAIPTVVADVDPSTIPPDAEHWIRIDRSERTVSLMAGDVVLESFTGRIGRDESADGFYATALGTFHVYSKNKSLAPTPFAEDTWLSDWVGFDPVRKNGIHSPVRESNGTVREWQNETTLGCVRLSEDDAVSVFDFAEIGMRVEVVD